MKKCPKCKKNLNEKYNYCPKCGKKVQMIETSEKSIMSVIIYCLGFIAFLPFTLLVKTADFFSSLSVDSFSLLSNPILLVGFIIDMLCLVATIISLVEYLKKE